MGSWINRKFIVYWEPEAISKRREIEIEYQGFR